MKRQLITIILLTAFLSLAANFALAQPVGEVRIGSTVIFRFIGDGSQDPAERARTVSERIEGLLDSTLTPSDVRVVKEGENYSIYWGSEFITQVDKVQSILNKSTPQALARVWAANFKKALSSNLFYIVPSSLVMASGRPATVRVGGVMTGPIQKESDNGNIHVSINQSSKEITVTPTGVGNTKVTFRRGNQVAVLYVKIQEPAAEIPAQLSAQVTGNPAPRQVLEFVAQSAIKNQIRVKPGARMEITAPPAVPESLKKGQSVKALVSVKISGRDYAPIKEDIPVTITNDGEGFGEIKTLMVSDRPETINNDGILFRDDLVMGSPARLLYYHKNASPQNRIVWVELKNNTSETVKVLTNGAMAGPSRWGVSVGHMSAMRFLESHRDGVAYTLTIPPGKSMTLVEIDIPQEQVICGYMHLQLTEGKKVQVLVKNTAQFKKETAELPILHQPFDPFRIHPKGTFTPANLHCQVTYSVGQDEEAACVIGMAPWLIDPVTGEPNNGNYGVFYNFDLTLKNPTNKKKRIGFYLVPEGVLARGSFIIKGKLMETGIARKPEKLLFAIIDLLPGEIKQMDIITTPEGGSYYPAKVVLETVEDENLTVTKPKDPDEPEKEEKPDDYQDWPPEDEKQ